MNPEIKALIETYYGFRIASATPGPRQWVAETHILEASDGRRYFLKYIHHPRFAPRPKQGLPALVQLYEKGFRNISYPIATEDGHLFLEGDGWLLILFNFIRGQQAFDFDAGQFGELNARLHKMTGELTVPLASEAFEPPYLSEFPAILDRALAHEGQGGLLAQVAQFVEPYQEEIYRDWERFLRIRSQCRDAQFPTVITHSDAPGNVMEDGQGQLILVDWDDVLLAPPERDTWFYAGSPAFLNGYRRIFPDYQIDPLAYRYYLYSRYWEDIYDFLEEILGAGSATDRASDLEGLEGRFGWLRPSIRELDASW